MDGLHNAVWAAVAITATAGIAAAFLLRGSGTGSQAAVDEVGDGALRGSSLTLLAPQGAEGLVANAPRTSGSRRGSHPWD